MLRGSKVLFVLASWISLSAFAAGELARDVEALRNSLPVKDPSRPTLTLRLADILFDDANALAGRAELSIGEEEKLGHMRRKALGLYQEALKGTQFHAPLQGQLAIKVKFQTARLMNDLMQPDKAESLWLELVKQEELQPIRREAALQLAEYYDKKNSAAAYKQADIYYQLAIELCGGGDVCSYAHYRRAWSLRDQGRLDAGIEEMQKALYDAKGQPRDESLRDLVTFLSEQKGDGEKEMLLVEEIISKTARKELFEQLSDSFYSNGNRLAGTRVLAYVNQREPKLSRQIRLLEEYYGLREWDKFQGILDQAMAMPKELEGMDPKSKTLLKRLSVQLDAERTSRPQYVPEFQKVVQLFLKQDPKSDDRVKMLEGWFASEKDPAAKMELLKSWAANEEYALPLETRTDFHVRRLSIAGKEKNNAIVEEEAGYLSTVASEAARSEEYKYLQSYAMFEQEKFDATLAFLNAWVVLGANAPSDWVLRGQLLLLDILVKQKKYDDLVAKINPWLESPLVAQAAKASKQNARWKSGLEFMVKARDEAEFELAVAGGESERALDIFAKHCFSKRFLPKSCDNARVLSVKLKKQPVLIKILKEQDRQDELAAEYEASGLFSESAAILEKASAKAPTVDGLLKISLLYELGADDESRDKVLTKLMGILAKEKSLGEKEPLIKQTLADAKMLDTRALKLPWSEKVKLQMTDGFVTEGKGNKEMEKQLKASLQYTGPAWANLVMQDLEALDKEHRKIGFYGAQSKRKFQQRLAKMQKLEEVGEKYFPGADLSTRTHIAALMLRSYRDLAAEILSAPAPKDLTPDLEEQLKTALNQMAEPFQKKAEAYEKLAKDQIAVVSEPTQKTELEALLVPTVTVAQIIEIPKVEEKKTDLSSQSLNLPLATNQIALKQLQDDPNSPDALKTIQQYYQNSGNIRLASYFQGRLLNLGGAKEMGSKETGSKEEGKP